MIHMARGRPLKARPTGFGQRLAEARKKAGLSQAQLGELLGLSQRAIAHWELRDTTALRPDQVQILAEVFDMSVEELLLGSENGKQRVPPGPKGKIRRTFEAVAKLPPKEQKQIMNVVTALIAQAKAGKIEA